jgi:alkanesulfonate monooxygenase SsuD/methylene tetrahydromethanopterin reductase-like flavin-dependent oxidoreductase (luciferase family)
VQRPHPPIAIGGRGRKRTLRTTARWAQHWNAITASPEEWRELRDVLGAHCAELGRDPAEITCSVNIRLDSAEDIESAAAAAAAYRDAGADMAVVGVPLGAPPSLVEQLADLLAPLA